MAVCLPDESLRMYSVTGSPAEQAYAFVRKYTTNEPVCDKGGIESEIIDSSSDYAYKDTLFITGSSDGAQSDYQVKVIVRRQADGASTGDTDDDGLPDYVETHGFKDGLGHTYYTLPDDSDTDDDGLDDGDEAGTIVSSQYCEYSYNLVSYPNTADSDIDGIDDPDEAEFDTSPLKDDWDNDGLKDGFELEIGTEPLLSDTDYDDRDDFLEYWGVCDEINGQTVPPTDPLMWEEHYGSLEVGRDLVLGATLGEWGAADHDSVYYMAGWLLSGYVVVGDVRDIASSIWNGDGLGVLTNAIAFLPLAGDAEKTISVIGKFAGKHAYEAVGIASFALKTINYDDPSFARRLIDASLDAGTTSGLRSKGITDEAIASLLKQDIDVKRLNQILDDSKLFNDFNYDGLATFIKYQMTLDGAILKGRCTVNLKKMVAADRAGKPVIGYLNNLKGAYTEYLAKMDTPGIAIIELKHVNKGGIDYAALDSNTLKIVEAKARQSLSINELENYIKLSNGVPAEFNINYVIKELGESYFKDPGITTKEFTLYLNGPNSQAIKESLNLPSSLPYSFKSKDTATLGQMFSGDIHINVLAVNI